MSFLLINGIALPTAPSTAKQEIMRGSGSLSVSPSGAARDSRLAARIVVSGESTCLPRQEAMSFRNMIVGYGHVLSFYDGMETSTGANPVTGYEAWLDRSQSWQPGGAALVVPVGNGISWDLQLLGSWTVIYRAKVGVTWHHFAVRSDKREAMDGTIGFVGASNQIYVDPVNGRLYLTGIDLTAEPEQITYADVMAVPWLMPDDHMEQITASSLAKPPMPSVHVSGDAIDLPSGWYAAGEVGPAKMTMVSDMKMSDDVVEGSHMIVAYSFDFTLRQTSRAR